MRLEQYRNGLKCKFTGKTGEKPPGRGMVTFLSKKSKKRLTWIYSQKDWKSMLTLTYHKMGVDYRETKKHLNVFLRAISRDKLKYLWVVEFQSRGAVHYHVWLSRELTLQKRKKYMRVWLRATIKYNGSKEAVRFHMHERVYSKWDVKVNLNYAAKYAAKLEQKMMPVGFKTIGRWWGGSRGVVREEMSIDLDTDKRSVTTCIGGNIVYHKKNMSEGDIAIIDYEFTGYRRNVKRAIFKWCKRRKQSPFDRRTNSGFTYLLIDKRKDCMTRLLTDALKNIYEQTGEWLLSGCLSVAGQPTGAIAA